MLPIKKILFLTLLCTLTCIYSKAINTDSSLLRLQAFIEYKMKGRIDENELLAKQGLPKNHLVFIDAKEMKSAALKEDPTHIKWETQLHTDAGQLTKLWDFKLNPFLQKVSTQLDEFSKKNDIDYYIVIAAIYNMDDELEETDFSKLSWANVSSIAKPNQDDKLNRVNIDQHKFKHLVNAISTKITVDKNAFYHVVLSAFYPDRISTNAQLSGKIANIQFSLTGANLSNNQALLSFAGEIKSPIGGGTKEERLLNGITSEQAFIASIKDFKEADLAAIDDADSMQKKLQNIPGFVNATFTIITRKHILQVLSGNIISAAAQKIICTTIEQTPLLQANDLIKAMVITNPSVPDKILEYPLDQSQGASAYLVDNYKKTWCLLQCIIDGTSDAVLWGDNNYQRLIKAFVGLTPKNKADVLALLNNKTNTILWGKSSWLNLNPDKDIGSTNYEVSMDKNNGTITLSQTMIVSETCAYIVVNKQIDGRTWTN